MFVSHIASICIISALPAGEMNSGVMVLEPSELEYTRMQRLMNDRNYSIPVWWGGNVSAKPPTHTYHESIFVGSDPGDQSIWRSFYPSGALRRG